MLTLDDIDAELKALELERQQVVLDAQRMLDRLDGAKLTLEGLRQMLLKRQNPALPETQEETK